MLKLLHNHCRSTVISVFVALSTLLVPSIPHSPIAAGAAVGVQQMGQTPPPVSYKGTAVATWLAPPDLAPRSATRDLGTNRITSTWAFGDATHYRIDSRVDGPGLNSNENTVVANGQHVIWYSSMANRALQMPAAQGSGTGMVGLFTGIRVLPAGTSLQQYLHTYNNKSTGTHDRYIGQGQVLGRASDIIDIWPVYRVSNKNSGPCNSAKACLKQEHGVGRTRVWLDHQYAVVLRTQESGIPANSSFERHFLYKVTSITFGQGPTPTQLAYTPPGPIVPAPHGNVSSSGSTTSGTASWRLPAPFLSITDLKGPNGEPYLLDGAGEAGDPTLGEPAMEDAIFAPHTGGISAHDPYVYVEERIRVDGVPATLRTGQAISMGPCEAWSGAYPDGLNHLAVSRGRIAVLLVSNALSQADLQHYARVNLCG